MSISNSLPTGIEQTVANDLRERLVATILLIGFLVGMLGSIWLPALIAPKIFLVLVLVLLSLFVRFDRQIQGASVQRQPLIRAWRDVAGLTMVMATVFCLAARLTGAWSDQSLMSVVDKTPWHWLSVKMPTVALQQWILQMLLMPALALLFKSSRVVILMGAGIFSLMHLPNPLLSVITFAVSIFWISSYQRHHRLTPLIASHFLLAVIAASLGGEYMLNMRVGPKCLEMFPTPIAFQNKSGYEMHQCVVGFAERMTQSGDRITIEGWVVDCIDDAPPRELLLEVGGQLHTLHDVRYTPDGQATYSSAANCGFVDDACFVFEAAIDTKILEPGKDAHLWGMSAGGWYSLLGQNGRIASLANLPNDRPFVAFPQMFEGQVENCEQIGSDIQLKGWISNPNRQLPLKQIYVEAGRTKVMFDLKEQFANQSKNGKNSFQVRLHDVDVESAKQIRCFVLDEENQIHRLFLTPEAAAHVAKLDSSLSRTFVR